MLNVIYSACWADPWLQVAKELNERNNINPLIWIGYEADQSEKLVPETFTGVEYIDYYGAWKGIFPDSMQPYTKDLKLGLDFYRDNTLYEIQALTMMDRMDPDRHSFSFTERQRHYRNLLKRWSSVLEYYKPDAIISATVPHRVYDYVLYMIARERGIPFIALRETAFRGRVIPILNISEIDQNFVQDYKNIRETNFSKDELWSQLDQDIIDRYKTVKGDYENAEPQYMKRHVNTNQKESSIIGNIQKVFNRVHANSSKFVAKNGYLSQGFPTYHKKRKKSLEESRFSFFDQARRKLKANRYKKHLKNIYDNLVTRPDYEQKYVFLALHYQPEMTSNPAGDIFADQKLCVEILRKNLPNDYRIYIKEHKSQFYSHTEGHTARIKEFYDDVLQYENVFFVPLEEDTFKLIGNAKAVSTVTGTIGWEAMVRQKPVVIFGLAWYESYLGVLKIDNQQKANRLQEFIEGFKYDEKSIIAYLSAFNNNSFRAYYFRGLKDKMDMTEKECVNNLCSHVLNNLKKANVINKDK